MDVFGCGDADHNSDNELETFVDLVPSPQELHKKYQQFLKANGSRNNSGEWEDVANFPDDVCDLSDAACSSNGSEFSFHEADINDLMQKNKSYRLRNTDLRTKNSQLLRSLETYEDEAEKQRNKIQDLEKEIKSYHEVDRERGHLHQELEMMQKELMRGEEKREMLEEEIIRRKNNEEEALEVVGSLRDQVDTLGNEVRCLNEVNQIKRDEATELKEKFLRLTSEFELKSFDVEQKEEVIKGMKLQLDEYIVLHKNLQEEKEKLMNELREGQLEVSSYQNFFKFPEDVAPIKSPKAGNMLHDLKSELAAADENSLGSSFYGAGRELRSPSSPIDEVFHSYLANRSLINGSMNSSTLGTPIAEPRHFFVRKEDNFTQTEKIVRAEESCQTVDTFIEKEEIETLLQVQEHCTELMEKLKWKEEETESLNEYLDLERSQKKYFTTQLEVLRKKYIQVQSLLDKKVEEGLHLTDVISKLCTNKLHTWYRENFCNSTCDSLTQACSKNQETYQCSKLVESLSLETFPLFDAGNQKVFSIVDDQIHENIGDLYRKMAVCLESDYLSLDAKIFVMNKCCSLVMEVIDEKLNKIDAILKNKCFGMELDLPVDTSKQDTPIAQSPVETLMVVKSLISHLASMSRNASSLRHTAPYVKAFKVFMHHTSQLNRTIQVQKSTVTSQREQSIPIITETSLAKSVDSDDPSLLEEPSVDEISVDFLSTLMFSQFKSGWFKKVLSYKRAQDVACNVYSTCCRLQNMIEGNPKSTLVLFFLLCIYLSITPLDYRVDPVF